MDEQDRRRDQASDRTQMTTRALDRLQLRELLLAGARSAPTSPLHPSSFEELLALVREAIAARSKD
ncbi:type II toxin-antitoxin system ParD family antitoxin [Cupriavidus necator]|uniref:type II toxin-antitoxin system ParD family antitoxin n=1 Tax=Cupriavidus necator TaxID=106590 RepID=UPI00339D816F